MGEKREAQLKRAASGEDVVETHEGPWKRPIPGYNPEVGMTCTESLTVMQGKAWREIWSCERKDELVVLVEQLALNAKRPRTITQIGKYVVRRCGLGDDLSWVFRELDRQQAEGLVELCKGSRLEDRLLSIPAGFKPDGRAVYPLPTKRFGERNDAWRRAAVAVMVKTMEMAVDYAGEALPCSVDLPEKVEWDAVEFRISVERDWSEQ